MALTIRQIGITALATALIGGPFWLPTSTHAQPAPRTRYLPMGPRWGRLPVDVRTQLRLVEFLCDWISVCRHLRTLLVWILGLWTVCRLRLDVAYVC